MLQIARLVERSLRSGLRRLSLVRGNSDHPGLIKEFKGLRGVILWHTEGSNPTPSASHKSLLQNGFSGHSMNSNLSRNFRGLRPMRLSVVAY